jgi:hypothetical protein
MEDVSDIENMDEIGGGKPEVEVVDLEEVSQDLYNFLLYIHFWNSNPLQFVVAGGFTGIPNPMQLAAGVVKDFLFIV